MSNVNNIKIKARRARQILQQEGWTSLLYRLKAAAMSLFMGQPQSQFDQGYKHYYQQHLAVMPKHAANDILAQLTLKPRISIIVPVYNVDARWLNAMIQSVIQQSYPNWQLCLVDDCSNQGHVFALLQQAANNDERIVIAKNARNSGIAHTSNHAASLANGDFLALLDHDDLLHGDALLHNVITLNQHPTTELLYSDEDKIDLKDKPHTPFFKPDFSLDLLRSQNYFGHFIVIKTTLFQRIGGFHTGVDGAQDYDLLLRAVDATTHIQHIPKVLYHWRQIKGSTAQHFSAKDYAAEAGREALQRHLNRQKTPATAHTGPYAGTYNVQYPLPSDAKVSIIIPFKDKPELLEQCLRSIIHNNDWANFEIIGINNQSHQPQTRQTINYWQQHLTEFSCLDYDEPFNFAAICNFAAEQATGDYLLFMNNDIEITSKHFIQSMLQHAARPDIGAVGAKLVYPNQTIQHAGIVIGIGNSAGHVFKHLPANHPGYFLRTALTHNVSAVTAALMMVKKSAFVSVGGFDQVHFSVAFNDVDFCLKLMRQGLRNIYTPKCSAIHHESSSRGSDISGQNAQRFAVERSQLQTKWAKLFHQGDPHYNPNLTLQREDYSLRFSQKVARTKQQTR